MEELQQEMDVRKMGKTGPKTETLNLQRALCVTSMAKFSSLEPYVIQLNRMSIER